jgi:hypothetical protein
VPILPRNVEFPDIEIPDVEIPELEVGPTEEYREQIPLDGTDEARVNVRFGAGDITLAAGDADQLFDGTFRTNVAQWAPEVSWENDRLRIDQGSSEGIPVSDDFENEWELAFSPEPDLEMDLEIGASDGELDFTGLALTDLSLETGASNLDVYFNQPNPADMNELKIQAGAADLLVEGIGNASPDRVRVDGGVGDLSLDFTGDWANSTDVNIMAGASTVTLRFPRNVGVQVSVEGLSGVDADADFSRSGDTYTNSAFGTADVEIVVDLSVGVGDVNLELVGE